MSLRERAFLTFLARSSRPILVGPWRSEIGFEVLYWLPWLNRFRRRYKIPRERLIAVTRGGAGIWYDAEQSVDLYDYVPVDRVRKAMLKDAKQYGSVKQYRLTPWEQKLIPLIAEDLGLRRYHVLHPRWMYQGFADWWNGKASLETAMAGVSYDPFPVPHPPLSLPLPERYVAVRFYARHTFPPSEEMKLWVAGLVEKLAKKVPVVLLDTPFIADDHSDFPIEGPNILSIRDHVTLQNNLAVQSAVIAKAQAFVGTYGGTMQLAVRLKKPSMGFYSTFEGTAHAHKDLTHRLGTMLQTPVFVGRPDDGRFIFEVMA